MTSTQKTHWGVCAPAGFLAGGTACGIKKEGDDLAIIFSEYPATAAGVFTTNRVKGASLLHTIEVLKHGRARAVIANSGNANACVGEQGLRDAAEAARVAGEALRVPAEEVIIASTGVVGVPLPMKELRAGIRKLAGELSRRGAHHAARAIMTTDTHPKEATVELEVGGCAAKIGGMAKGAGMIAPNMATMLAFLTTDVAISTPMLKKALRLAVDNSFNNITVDGDMSPCDSVVILANGQAGNPKIASENGDFKRFHEALDMLCMTLAQQVVRDGEGATKLVEVRVRGAASPKDARLAARTVAESLLVKTALFGEDANWGRIATALGYSGVKMDPNTFDIYLDGVQLAAKGQYCAFDEKEAKQVLKLKELSIIIDLKMGPYSACVWTTDLSYDYVKINASYRS